MNVMVYAGRSMEGWARQLVDGRLCRTVLRYPLLLVAGAGFWNLEFSWAGAESSRRLALVINGSVPSYAAIILFVAYTLVAPGPADVSISPR